MRRVRPISWMTWAVVAVMLTACAGGAGPGEPAQEQVWTWERRGDRVLLHKQSYAQVAPDSAPIHRSVMSNNYPPIIKTFEIEAENEDSTAAALQRAYLEEAESLLTEEPPEISFLGGAPDISRSDIRPLLRSQLRRLRTEAGSAAQRASGAVARAHLEDIVDRITRILEGDGEGG